MANTLTGYNTTFLGFDVSAIAEEVNSIKQLTAQIVPFDSFTTPLKNIPQGITTVTIPVPVYPTGSAANAGGVTVFDASTNTITVKCGTDIGVFYAFNPVEAQNNGITNLATAFIAPAIYGCECTIASASFSIASSTTNFATSSTKPAVAAAFSASALTNIVGELGTKNIYGERFVLTTPSYYWSGLMTSLASMNNQAAANAIQSGSPNNPFGLVVKECGVLPTTVGNIVGLAGAKSALVVATSVPQVTHANGEQFVYVSPRSNLPFLVERYFDDYRRSWVIGASCLYGVSKGLGSLLQIVSS